MVVVVIEKFLHYWFVPSHKHIFYYPKGILLVLLAQGVFVNELEEFIEKHLILEYPIHNMHTDIHLSY